MVDPATAYDETVVEQSLAGYFKASPLAVGESRNEGGACRFLPDSTSLTFDSIHAIVSIRLFLLFDLSTLDSPSFAPTSSLTHRDRHSPTHSPNAVPCIDSRCHTGQRVTELGGHSPVNPLPLSVPSTCDCLASPSKHLSCCRSPSSRYMPGSSPGLLALSLSSRSALCSPIAGERQR